MNHSRAQKDPDLSIDDIAKAAGVSVSTVSRILNDKPDVSEATRTRVLGVVRKMGYAPHPLAQRLAKGRSDAIALVHPIESGQADDVLLGIILAASAVAERERFFFSLVTRPVTKRSLKSFYDQHYVDGVILMQIYLNDWRVEFLKKQNLPFVMIGRTAECDGLSFVDPDFEQAVTTVLDYLYDLGHRKVGFISGPGFEIEKGYGPFVRQRAAYLDYVRRRGLPDLTAESDFTFSGSMGATEHLLGRDGGITAIISSSGQGIAGVMEAANKHGLRVPEDISIVSSSSSVRMAESVLPTVTSVNMETESLGAIATEMLIHILKGRRARSDTPEQKLLAPRFVVRGSSAAPRRA